MLKLAIVGFLLYALWAINQGQRRQAKWAFIGAAAALALILMNTWKEWYVESLNQ